LDFSVLEKAKSVIDQSEGKGLFAMAAESFPSEAMKTIPYFIESRRVDICNSCHTVDAYIIPSSKVNDLIPIALEQLRDQHGLRNSWHKRYSYKSALNSKQVDLFSSYSVLATKIELSTLKKQQIKERKKAKTINSRYSLVVTHPTTNRPAHGLSMTERTGSPVFHALWSIAERSAVSYIINYA
jgi:hypothetical protein